eukprot:TRINITY_DN3698_c0_g2_i4.p1 TRINITY_DN3698_c0_g2~~TRINITY_DN3698_c0_g2_i4.p1  ORF type:complete len:141 (+),score=34.50 TRINITY_DN3698_c0_g2_i4:60-482(+)
MQPVKPSLHCLLCDVCSLRERSNAKSAMGTANSRLLSAAKEGDVVQIEQALNEGADVNAVEPITAETAMHHAAEGGHIVAIDLLSRRGANMEQPNTFGCTALHLAVQANNIPGVKALLEYGASVEARDIVNDFAILRGKI